MKLFIRIIVTSALLSTLQGCSTTGSDNVLAVSASKPAEAKTKNKNSVTLRILPYADARNMREPKLLGQIKGRVLGIYGKELMTDHEVAQLATTAIRKHFEVAGYQVQDGADPAMFEVSGVVRELTLNVRDRDDISIALDTTLKDTASNKVIWSALVTEKNERYAGVAGNSKSDVILYLNTGLHTVSSKTVEAVDAMLVATRPELFNLTAGTKMISGVAVYSAPAEVKPGVVSVSGYQAVQTGVLSLTTTPAHAKVYLDDVYFGLSPLRSAIEPGVHRVMVKLNGYKAANEKISVRKGETTELELSLER